MTVPHYEQPNIICPHCDYQFTDDDMHAANHDLWALAQNEETTDTECPSCDLEFFVQGGYKPHYSTAFAEEEF